MNVVEFINQAKLESVLQTIFPHDRSIKNARKEISLKSPLNGEYLEVDLWYPDLKLCFEFQDEYHYHSTWYCQIPLSLVKSRDNYKRDLLLRRGETLILVPCWWDGSSESLRSTINFHRPEMFAAGDIIPANFPQDFFAASIVPKNMQLMHASFPNPPEFPISGLDSWWLGEKYDGVRCYWNPAEKQLYSRHGFLVGIHPLARAIFGSIVFDGEIWCGRGMFLESQKLINALDKIDWSVLRIVCFDEASQKMSSSEFERRYSRLLSHFSPEHPTIIIASRFLCTSQITLTQGLRAVVSGGGEGVIMRKPLSTYQRERSTSLLKIKATRADQDALVVTVTEDDSLVLQLPDGTRFIAQKENCVLPRRAVRGDVVTFTHDFASRQLAHAADETQEVHALRRRETQDSQSVPSNAVVYRIRNDVLWKDVVLSSDSPIRHFLNVPSVKRMENAASRPRGYWLYQKGRNMRAHLESIAKSHGFNPLIAENWYNTSRQDLLQHKEVRTIILHYGNSLIKALVDLFPELHLDVSKFAYTPMSYWVEAKNRRGLYEKFAKSRGADPLDPQFWYDLSFKEGLLIKGAGSIISYHGNSVTQPLVDLFPEVANPACRIPLRYFVLCARDCSSWRPDAD